MPREAPLAIARSLVKSGSTNKIGGQFAWRLIEMLRSPVNQVLSLSARRFLDRLEIELADHGGKENGRLPVTYADLEAFGLDRHAIAPAIRELEALGLIQCTERGRAGNAEFRTPSLYRLTYRPTGRLPPTDEWRRITTVREAEVIAKAARREEHPRKQKASGGKHHISVGKTHTENGSGPVGGTLTTVVGETPTTFDISGRVRAPCHHE